MDNENLQSLNEMEFADLPKAQEERLRELEKQFNNEFGLDYYFIVMDRRKS